MLTTTGSQTTVFGKSLVFNHHRRRPGGFVPRQGVGQVDGVAEPRVQVGDQGEWLRVENVARGGEVCRR